MTQAPHQSDPDEVALINAALRRETFEKIESGETLYRGQWIANSTVRRTRLRHRAVHIWRALELLVVLALVALLGVLFLVLIDAII